MNNPKFNKGNQAPSRQSKPAIQKYKTICKHVSYATQDACTRIDAVIARMEASGYDYYDHLDVSTNEKILIFKLIV